VSKYICSINLKYLIFWNRGSSCIYLFVKESCLCIAGMTKSPRASPYFYFVMVYCLLGAAGVSAATFALACGKDEVVRGARWCAEQPQHEGLNDLNKGLAKKLKVACWLLLKRRIGALVYECIEIQIASTCGIDNMNAGLWFYIHFFKFASLCICWPCCIFTLSWG
jgi:hypothetical protein